MHFSLPYSDTEAIELAKRILTRANELQTPQERRQQAELDRMIRHEEDKATLVEMTDQAFRTSNSARVADQLTHLLDLQGIPRFFSPVEQAMLKGFQSFGEYLPGVAVPLVKDKMRRETANVILPAEEDLLRDHLSSRQAQGVVMNVNVLGEALLGHRETSKRMAQLLETLRLPEVRCLSIKISTLYSQISPLARRQTIRSIAVPLEQLYRAALSHRIAETNEPKFIYLDMEEYRDLQLTAEVLKQTLDHPGLEEVRAGIALQAYIPDSHRVLRDLIAWSRDRVARGARPLTIRLVKGANMEMERVEASIGGWPQAPYKSKQDTDANFKRMMRATIDAASRREIGVGIASHNLFDIALAILWTERAQAGDAVQLEMLEGMANHQRRALTERGAPMLLYAPACRREDFLHAIGYLIRRLDENTGPENFLRHAYHLKSTSPEFEQLAHSFRQSLAMIDSVSDAPRRTQDQRQRPHPPAVASSWQDFVNEPDTDWSLPHNGEWIEAILEKWRQCCDDQAPEIPLTFCTDTETSAALNDPEANKPRDSFDPSRPGVVSCRYTPLTLDQVTHAVSIAAEDPTQWRGTRADQRHETLRRVAQQIRERRGEFIASMVADAGKTVSEADPEISEAIDFCEFYPLTMREWESHEAIETRPRGVVAVITPWNFPLAIPCGGISAALAAGNTVLLKPASETVLPAAMLCQAFWDAGVPRAVLQMVPCDDQIAEHALVRNVQVDAVVLTGATSTAKRMLAARPGLHLLAETGGKNATIVTAMADRDLAIKHVVQSAFGHAGQKCSATSLLLLEDEVYQDENFRSTLADAVESLTVASAWDLQTRVGPLIHPPDETLARGMNHLDEGESWLVGPKNIEGNPNLFRPVVKWGVRPGNYSHVTELFGPVLCVMRFRRLEEAIEIVRSTGYGLTSGLESLDDREIDLWQRTIRAGNLYINRGTTGAIVLRQPFGGVGLSAYGPGVKAGGPHYVLALSHVSNRPLHLSDNEHFSEPEIGDLRAEDEATRILQWLDDQLHESLISPENYQQLNRVIASQIEACRDEFDTQHDAVRLVGQDNFRRYCPVRSMCIRAQACAGEVELLTAVFASTLSGCRCTVSCETSIATTTSHLLDLLADELPSQLEVLHEPETELAFRIRDGHVHRLRVIGDRKLGTELLKSCEQAFVTLVDEPVLMEGRIECLRYLDEQSVSHDYHRYGNLGRRASEKRREVL